MSNIAIIPARGGSKRVPGKNIKPFFGKPMIQYSIDAALESGVFETVLVTTDSPEIAEIAQKAGALVPMLRPKELSDDFAATAPVLQHALGEMAPKSKTYDYGCCILATAPFLKPKYLRMAYEEISSKKASGLVGVTEFAYPIFRAMKRNEEGFLVYVWPEYKMARSNDLPKTYQDAGQFSFFDVPRFLKTGEIMVKDTLALELPRHLVQDIDTPEDWEHAEVMYKALMMEKA